MMLGSGGEPQLLVSHKGKQPIGLQPFCFLFLVVFINYMRYSTVGYRIDFVLGGFAQLGAKLCVLYTFMGGKAKL